MAAMDSYHLFVSQLTPREREALQGLLRIQQRDLLAARSEEARVRLVNEFMKDAREFLSQTKKRS
jgi:hypothetical protein